jgi:flagellar M-ring protein FliF
VNRLQKILGWFNTLSTPKTIGYCLCIGLIITGFFLACWYVFTPTYAILFNHLDVKDANQMLQKLEKEHIDYRIQNNGHDILINEALVHKTRLKLMGSSLELTGNSGFELFDKNDFGMTDFSQKINYQRALQGELERTIASLDEIRYARVHLVMPEHPLFHQEDNPPKAAVTVYLKKTLTQEQIRSIQHLISSSIDRLSLKHVVIIDQYGNTLSSNQSNQNTYPLHAKKAIEQDLTDKAMHMLQALYPINQVVVKIDATLNYDELQRELITPHAKGQIIHEKEMKHPTTGKTKHSKQYQDITRETSYQLGTEKELFKRARGTIERLSISVMLPQNTNAKILQKVQDIVKNSVGFNQSRGDTISVAALIQNTPKHIKYSTPHKLTPTKMQAPYLTLGAVFIFCNSPATLQLD